MRISRVHLERILAHARSGYPFEVCGILVGRHALVTGVVPVENQEAERPRVRFEIDPADQIRVQREGREHGYDIVGYYHSHPDHPARPSETDRRLAAAGLSDGVLHLIVGVEGGQAATPSAWVFRDARQAFEAERLEVE